ncbi:MAG: tetratricopeptide repeat protein [Bacteroidetes bacterium]|nr:MAG: tetratricopeptide repeat protein [Bacteroidota bacterium]
MRFILFVFSSFCFLVGFAQSNDTLTAYALRTKGFQLSNPILDFPIQGEKWSSAQAFIASRKSDETYKLLLLFSIDDSLFVKISSLEITEESDYWCSDPVVSYSDELLQIECQWMKGITFVTELKVLDYQFSLVRIYQYDLNEDVYARAELAQKEDDPVSFCEAYLGAQYYSDLEYRVKESLEWAHHKAMQFYKNKDVHSAASIMRDLEERCALSTELYDFMGKDFIKIWEDITLIYLEAGLNEQCVQLSKKLLEIDPEIPGIHLQYADALYNLGKTNESKKMYQRYLQLVIGQKENTNIPPRALERSK